MTTKAKFELPPDVRWLINQLQQAGFDAYAVGGCVRDLLLARKPKDWDVTTNATPPQIQKVFPKTVYENRFGTVAVHHHRHIYEVTTYRTEGPYGDARHPNQVTFVKKIEDDLARRDFTINAMALANDSLVDPFGGQADLKAKLIRAVGNPDERFAEDGLRLLRAVRLGVELGFTIEPKTSAALTKQADRLSKISAERIRDELIKILASPDPAGGIRQLHQHGLLKLVIPELLEGEGMHQPKHHKYPVLDHSIRSLEHTPSADPLIRLAALLHDVGKPRSARGTGDQRTFHGHEVIGARMTKEIMKRLRFPKADLERVVNQVRHHMFLFQFESTDKAVRRIVRRVGPENIKDLVDLRVGDRLGSGCKIGYTTKLKQFEQRVIEVQQDPIDTRMLKVDGNLLMTELDLKPGPMVGQIMDRLLEEVLDDPKHNTRATLLKRAKALAGTLPGPSRPAKPSPLRQRK